MSLDISMLFPILPEVLLLILAGVILGLVDNFGKALSPEISYFTLFAPMGVVLALRPSGLFGKA